MGRADTGTTGAAGAGGLQHWHVTDLHEDGSPLRPGRRRGAPYWQRHRCFFLLGLLGLLACWPGALPDAAESGSTAVYELRPIGWVRKADGKTTIEIEERYGPALLGVGELDSIWVLYWFDRNDTPEQRSVLQVHPRRNPDNPIRGVFATRAPVRPNLIALSRCRVLAVHGTTIEIDGIDAFPDSPVLDIKP